MLKSLIGSLIIDRSLTHSDPAYRNTAPCLDKQLRGLFELDGPDGFDVAYTCISHLGSYLSFSRQWLVQPLRLESEAAFTV